MNVDLAIEIAEVLCQRFEGLYLQPYLCPAGYPTIGYGSRFYEDGTEVTLRDAAITKERAKAILTHYIRRVYLPAVAAICPGAKTAEQFAALIDFAYNLGAGRLRVSTLRKRVNDGNFASAKSEFGKWVYSAGRKLRGLVLRRSAESSLF